MTKPKTGRPARRPSVLDLSTGYNHQKPETDQDLTELLVWHLTLYIEKLDLKEPRVVEVTRLSIVNNGVEFVEKIYEGHKLEVVVEGYRGWKLESLQIKVGFPTETRWRPDLEGPEDEQIPVEKETAGWGQTHPAVELGRLRQGITRPSRLLP
jgi:hypothetical protein